MKGTTKKQGENVSGQKGYPERETAKRLLDEAVEINPGGWGKHSEIAALCAEKIAIACGLDSEKAYVLGLLHDIGRKFLVRDLGHIYYGYKYMLSHGYSDVARVCLTHSFPNQSLDIYIGKIDISEAEVNEVRAALSAIVFDDYDRLIQLCDALAGAEGVLDIEERMADVKRRYGNYPEAQWKQNLALKAYFEQAAGAQSIYDLLKNL